VGGFVPPRINQRGGDRRAARAITGDGYFPRGASVLRRVHEERAVGLLLASPGVHLTEEARHVGSAIMFAIPVPARSQPAMRVHNLVMLGMLPPRVRELYGLSWTTAQAAAFHGVVAGVRATRPLTPAPVRRGWNTRFFADVARAERRRGARGETIPGALSPL
jgi:ER-bound oxygenase mpaB/B'/Rubber oxygenase, catalytic domain